MLDIDIYTDIEKESQFYNLEKRKKRVKNSFTQVVYSDTEDCEKLN